MKMHMVVVLGAVLASPTLADELTIEMNEVDAQGVQASIGTVTVTDSGYGAVFTPDLNGLEPGLHGFHIHENPSCEPGEKDGQPAAGVAAGGHFDPFDGGKHAGPYADGHLGDLPALYVDDQGRASHPLLAPRVNTTNLKGRSLMVHAQGDNYSDDPEPLGGGGARVACGVVGD